MNDTASPTSEILVVGAGMAAHRFVERLLHDPGTAVRVTVIGDEGGHPYDRSSLGGVLSGRRVAELPLDGSIFRDERVRLVRDDRVLHIDRVGHSVRTRSRRTYAYDTLVLATGAYAARVAVEGARLPGCFVFRTIEDAVALRDFVDACSRALGRPLRGVVIGGGLCGLDVATALHERGVSTTVVQYADRLMPTQLDRSASELLEDALRRDGIGVRTRTRTTRLDPDESGAVTALEFQDGSFHRADVVVFTVGTRPRDELARNAGLDVHPLGGVLIDDRCRTSAPDILAIGEAACFGDRSVGLARSARVMAEVAAAHVLGGDEILHAHDESVHRTLAGLEIATFGMTRAHGTAVEVVVHHDPEAGVSRKLVLADDARTLLGGTLVGETEGYGALRASVGEPQGMPRSALRSPGSDERTTDTVVCAHLGLTHGQLSSEVRAAGLFSFSEIDASFGRNRNCDRCTLAYARVLGDLAAERRTSRSRSDAVDDPGTRIEPDGRYAVRPRPQDDVLTPAVLIALGRIAEEFQLTPRIASGRIELREVRPEHVAPLLTRLTAAGLAPDGRSGGLGTPDEAPQQSGAEEADRRPELLRAEPRRAAAAYRWGDRRHTGAPHREAPLRAENPA